MSLVVPTGRYHPACLLWGCLAEVGDAQRLYLQASPPFLVPSPARHTLAAGTIN